MLKKIGESLEIATNNIHSSDAVLSDPMIEERFKKFAGELRRIAPKADDFLYFSCFMLSAAECALINEDGSPKLDSRGKALTAEWLKKGESLSWKCSDPNVLPFKNSNGDIFNEFEILKAYKNWVGKPLCVDHKSNSVDAIRGVILDTFYDRTRKKVIALCALDKASYPDLARKVSTGYSTCVSMGTGVGKAICTDCGQVARTEADFCHHMKTKTGYGEINLDLQPIELSIVVNGADPTAKIRQVIAAAGMLDNYISATRATINKLSNSQDIQKIEELEQELKEATEKLAELKSSMEPASETVSAPYGASSGRVNPPSDEKNIDFGLNLPERLASNNDAYRDELSDLKFIVEGRLDKIEKSLESLSNKLHTTKEEIMSVKDSNMNKEAYFQGGGGVNEPTPGKPKYNKDPMNEKLREDEDKQMVGQKPFPDVGDVEGMHPSPESADEKDELSRKKMLLRAEVEQRSLRRAAALQKAKENIMNTKEAYFQGGGGVNEPTPGKAKYPVDGLRDKLREKEDKQMVGQKPFPGVGDVDGLHPSPASADEKDELSRKKLLQRAALKARFVKAANSDGTEDITKSAWHVFVDDKLALTASVDEISGGRAEVLYDTIATKEFGSKMLEKIRAVGFDKAAGLYKKSQAVAEQGAQPAAPQDAGGAGAVPAMPEMNLPAPQESPEAEDKGGKGDPKETAMKLAEKVRDMSSDLLEAVRALTGEQAEMGELEGLSAGKTAGVSLAALNNMRKELNGALITGMKKSLAELREHHDELKLIATIDVSDDNREYVDSVVEDAFTDAKAALADAFRLMGAFVKYARGTEGLLKRAAELTDDQNDARKAKKKSEDKDSEEDSSSLSEEDSSDANDFNLHSMDMDGDLDPMMNEDLEMPESEKDTLEDPELVPDTLKDPGLDMDMDSLSANDENDATVVELPDGAAIPAGATAAPKMASTFDLTTKAGRTAYRAYLTKVAVTGKEDSGEVMDESKLSSECLEESEALSDGDTQLDVKPSDDLGKVETKTEQHEKVLEVAKAEPKVRKEAERLNQLVSQGKVNPKDLDALIAQGLDPEVVKYWKEFYGDAGKEGSEFAAGLVKEYEKAKVAEEINTYKVKIARSYDLANDMVRRGLLADDRGAVTAQVEEIMKWNDEAFESMKRVVAKHAPTSLRKEAMSVPQVGLIGSGDAYSSNVSETDLQSQLDRAFSGRKY